MSKLTHLDDQGKASMVDVGQKKDTHRIAKAKARIFMSEATLLLISGGEIKKGDVFSVARIAGVMAAKKTADLIPLCHPLGLDNVQVDLICDLENSCVEITTLASCFGKTGIEMEALTAASLAALTIYDMCKAADKNMRISDIRLTHKSGGKSGEFNAD